MPACAGGQVRALIFPSNKQLSVNSLGSPSRRCHHHWRVIHSGEYTRQSSGKAASRAICPLQAYLTTTFVALDFPPSHQVFISFLSYLIEVYLMYSASALAANTIVRSAVGAAFPLFTTQMYTRLGVNWASTLIAGIGLLIAPSPFIFYKFGARIRGASKFAPCLDIGMRERVEREEREEHEKQEGNNV